MSVKVDDIIKLIELNEITYFYVSTTTGDNTRVFDMTEHETIEDAKSRFRRVMDLYPGGRFILKGRKTKNDTRGGFTYEFGNTNDQSTNNTPATVSGVPRDEVNNLIAEALAKAENERRMKEQDEEIKRLRSELKEKDTAMNRIITRLEPAIAPLINGFIGKMFPGNSNPQISMGSVVRENEQNESNNNEQNFEEMADELTKRLETAIERLAAVEPEYIELIEAVATMAENNDPTYTMAKGFLLKK